MPQKPDKFTPALYGGIIMGVLSATPFLSLVNCLCCAGIMLGGFMSVYFYKKALTDEMEALTSADGMGLGALAGVFGAIASTILSGLFFMMFGNIVNEAILEAMRSGGVLDQMPPDQAVQLEQQLVNQGFSLVGAVISFIICPLFGLLGGLIGYAVFRKRESKGNQRETTS
jgi:ammonia channel protein AmtB